MIALLKYIIKGGVQYLCKYFTIDGTFLNFRLHFANVILKFTVIDNFQLRHRKRVTLKKTNHFLSTDLESLFQFQV